VKKRSLDSPNAANQLSFFFGQPFEEQITQNQQRVLCKT